MYPLNPLVSIHDHVFTTNPSNLSLLFSSLTQIDVNDVWMDVVTRKSRSFVIPACVTQGGREEEARSLFNRAMSDPSVLRVTIGKDHP